MKMSRKQRIEKKHKSIRRKIFGTTERPRLAIYRSVKHIHAQIIDDSKGHTLVSASTVEKSIAAKIKTFNKSNSEVAKLIGAEISKRAAEKNITAVVFDRGGFLYSKVVKSLADAARENGLKF